MSVLKKRLVPWNIDIEYMKQDDNWGYKHSVCNFHNNTNLQSLYWTHPELPFSDKPGVWDDIRNESLCNMYIYIYIYMSNGRLKESLLYMECQRILVKSEILLPWNSCSSLLQGCQEFVSVISQGFMNSILFDISIISNSIKMVFDNILVKTTLASPSSWYLAGRDGWSQEACQWQSQAMPLWQLCHATNIF